MPEQSELARNVLDDLAGITPAGAREEHPDTPPAAPPLHAGQQRLSATMPSPSSRALGYIGRSTYRRKRAGLQKKIAIYVSPGVAAALRRAAATGDDPRGASMGEIVESLLRAHGYVETR